MSSPLTGVDAEKPDFLQSTETPNPPLVTHSSANAHTTEMMDGGQNLALNSADGVKRVQEHLELFHQMLSAVDPLTESLDENDLIQELLSTVRGAQSQCGSALQTVADESLVMSLLTLNEQLLQAIAAYNTVASGRPAPPPQIIPTAASSSGITSNPDGVEVIDLQMQQEHDLLGDFLEDVPSAQSDPGPHSSTDIPSQPQPSSPDSPFSIPTLAPPPASQPRAKVQLNARNLPSPDVSGISQLPDLSGNTPVKSDTGVDVDLDTLMTSSSAGLSTTSPPITAAHATTTTCTSRPLSPSLPTSSVQSVPTRSSIPEPATTSEVALTIPRPTSEELVTEHNFGSLSTQQAVSSAVPETSIAVDGSLGDLFNEPQTLGQAEGSSDRPAQSAYATAPMLPPPPNSTRSRIDPRATVPAQSSTDTTLDFLDKDLSTLTMQQEDLTKQSDDLLDFLK